MYQLWSLICNSLWYILLYDQYTVMHYLFNYKLIINYIIYATVTGQSSKIKPSKVYNKYKKNDYLPLDTSFALCAYETELGHE